jgi:hypothetical protein
MGTTMNKENMFERFKDALIPVICNPKLRYSEIAEYLSELANKNFTRSAVAGLISRNRDKIIASGFVIPDRTSVRKAEHATRQTIRIKTKKTRMPVQRFSKPILTAEEIPLTFEHAVDFLDRGKCQCPYPLWRHPEKIGKVCGAPQSVKYRSSYCDYHAVVCEPGRPR